MVSEETVDKMTSILVEFCERFYGWEASVAKLGKLSAPQLRTICVIGRNENIRMKDIADRMELTTGTVTVMIDRLQVMGYFPCFEATRRSCIWSARRCGYP